MGNSSAAQEPSMEEILASIRQIISEDDVPARDGPAARPPAASRPAPHPAEANGASAAVAPRLDPDKPAKAATFPSHPPPAAPLASRPAFSKEPPAVPNPAKAPLGSSPVASSRDERGLLSPDAGAAVSGAFNALAHTILSQNARTLEDLVVDLLRPMLRDWLDDNLPPLVERLVREEIERVSRGRR